MTWYFILIEHGQMVLPLSISISSLYSYGISSGRLGNSFIKIPFLTLRYRKRMAMNEHTWKRAVHFIRLEIHQTWGALLLSLFMEGPEKAKRVLYMIKIESEEKLAKILIATFLKLEKSLKCDCIESLILKS